jgi:hypothetical protein
VAASHSAALGFGDGAVKGEGAGSRGQAVALPCRRVGPAQRGYGGITRESGGEWVRGWGES